MNGVPGSSYYDTVNKIIIGYLLLYFFWGADHSLLYMTICAWIIGILYGGFVEYLIVPLAGQPIKAFRTNNLAYIKQEYKKVCVLLGIEPEIAHYKLSEYYKAYYQIEGTPDYATIKILECHSSFLGGAR